VILKVDVDHFYCVGHACGLCRTELQEEDINLEDGTGAFLSEQCLLFLNAVGVRNFR
jgi:hypothetical protein